MVLLALLAVVVLVSGALLAPGLFVGPSLDAAVFSHIGGRLLDSVAPYVGAWDHKPPGIYLLSAAAHAMLGWLGPWTADWLLSFVATVGIGLAIATALRGVGVSGWPRALGVIGATIVASQYLLALGGGLTEAPATFLVGWALVLALRPPSIARAGGIGFLVGLSLLLSIQLLPGGAAVLVLALVLAPRGERLTQAVAIGFGFLVPLSVATMWLAVIGALPGAFDAIVKYSTAYRGSNQEYGAILAAPVAAWTVLASLLLLAPAIFGASSMGRMSPRNHAVATGGIVWIGLSVVLFVVQGRFFAHYAIPLVVPLGILAGHGLQRAGDALRRTTRFGQRALIVLPFALTVMVSLLAGVVGGTLQLQPVAEEQRRVQAVSEQLSDLPPGALFAWGNTPRLYDAAGRVPATRYSYLYPLTTPGYTTALTISELARVLAEHPPAVIVDAGSSAPGEPGFPPLLIDRPIATDGRDLDLLDPLRAFVSERYDLVATVAGWPIYVLRGELEEAQ